VFAIVKTCGKQYRVSTGDTITVDRLSAEEGAEIVLDQVLMVDDKVGTPTVDGASVKAKVLGHELGDKVLTFKYRARQRRRRRVGFRARQTTLEILSIDA